jgi:two-component system chemotaxis response regulator CheB
MPEHMPKRVRVLIVDDSALVRKVLSDTFARDPEIEVVGTAVDPYAARDKIVELRPDVLTLDIEMPRMDGLTFLRLLMKHHPIPVVIMSSLTAQGSAKALEALQSGAVDVIAKPGGSYSAQTDGVAERVKAAAHARMKNHLCTLASEPASPPPAPPASMGKPGSAPIPRFATIRPPIAKPALPAQVFRTGSSKEVILMGASTGGTEALKAILTRLPAGLPGMAIVQHIPAHFSAAFANRLNELCAFEVREARHGDLLKPNLALVAPGGFHMLLRPAGAGYQVVLNENTPVHHQRPAVDVLFDSAVKTGTATHALALLLTGMGSDGATGMLNLRHAGALTAAQNEDTCVVFGMPKEAIKLGAAQQVLALQDMPAFITKHFS